MTVHLSSEKSLNNAKPITVDTAFLLGRKFLDELDDEFSGDDADMMSEAHAMAVPSTSLVIY